MPSVPNMTSSQVPFAALLLLILAAAGCSALVNPDEGRLGGDDGGTVRTDSGTGDAAIDDDASRPDSGNLDAGSDSAPSDGGTDASVICAGGCDDGIDCTNDSCVAGTCMSVRSNSLCRRGERCDATLGCVRSRCMDDRDCDDGLFCNGEEQCDRSDPGADDVGCLPGDAVTCDDGAGCSSEACDETTDACEVTLDDAACNDGVDCSADTCAPGADGADSDGCVNTADDTLCDTDFCIVGRRCNLSSGGCTGGTARDCRDGNACTVDSCDSATSSCINAPRDDDGDGFATESEGSMMCTGGTDCDDDNASVHPGATEFCNRRDDDCDGVVDDGCISVADTCADAEGLPIAVGGGTVTVRGTLADFDSDYETPCGRAGGRDAVYYVDVSTNVDLYIDTLGSAADTVVSVATSCDLTGFAELGCDDDIDQGRMMASRIWVHRFRPTTIGSTRRLYILVDGYDSSTNGAFQLNVRAELATGDSCGAPIDISGGGSLIGFLTPSVLPLIGPRGSCQPSGSGADLQAVASFHGPGDGNARFDVYSDDFDPDVYVRAAPCASGTEIACVAGAGGGAAGFLYRTRLDTTTTSGSTYYLFADGAAGGDSYWVSFEP